MDHNPASAITEANKDLVSSIKEKLEAVSPLKSIFRVPERFLKENEKMYIPNTVSIGPLHHGKEGLKYMEDRKWHYLFTLLNRQPNKLESSLHEFVNALSELEKPARKFYAEELNNLTSNQFIEMMLVDGCFIIELFLKYALKGIRRRGDPMLTTPGLLSRVRCELLLLENQIPFLILQRLFQIVVIPKKYDLTLTLSELAIRFFRNMLPGDKDIVNEKFSQECYHLLDLIRQCYLPTYVRVMSKNIVPHGDLENASATKLKKDGIKSRSFKAKSLLNIKFANGVLEVPPFTPHHHFTEILFSNLIALEQHQNDSQPFTSYAILMKALVCNEKDVKLFRNRGILIMDSYTEKEVCELFQRLCKEVEFAEDKFYFAGFIEHIFEYKRTWRSWRKLLKCCWLKTRTSTR